MGGDQLGFVWTGQAVMEWPVSSRIGAFVLGMAVLDRTGQDWTGIVWCVLDGHGP